MVNYGRGATTGPPPALVSKVLLEHNHNLSFTHSKAAFTLQGSHYMPTKPKYSLSDPLQKKFGDCSLQY